MADTDAAHGTLGKEFYVILTRPVKPAEEVMKVLPKHLERQVELEKAGILFAAGPLFEDGAERAHAGLIIIRAKSFAEAKEIADADPLHAAGLREYTVDRWSLNEGSYSLTVNYSDQTVSIG